MCVWVGGAKRKWKMFSLVFFVFFGKMDTWIHTGIKINLVQNDCCKLFLFLIKCDLVKLVQTPPHTINQKLRDLTQKSRSEIKHEQTILITSLKYLSVAVGCAYTWGGKSEAAHEYNASPQQSAPSNSLSNVLFTHSQCWKEANRLKSRNNLVREI